MQIYSTSSGNEPEFFAVIFTAARIGKGFLSVRCGNGSCGHVR